MKDENVKERQPFEWPKMTDDELRQFVLGVADAKIFIMQWIREPDLIPAIFMPIGLGGLQDLTEAQVHEIGTVWEWMDKAGPRSINGYPIFFSMHLMHADEWTRAAAALRTEFERRKSIPV